MSNQHPNCLIIGAGISGLVTAKELIDVGIENITILEKSDDLGGLWRTYCWKTCTMTSSKWITEFGGYPMPDHYPDFLTPELMLEYLRSFAQHFDLERRVQCGVSVTAVVNESDGRYTVETRQNSYTGVDYVVVCTGLHGKPDRSLIPGIDQFKGIVIHGSEYKTPDIFANKSVLCVGLGESGFGINGEVSSAAAKTFVASSPVAIFPRVFPETSIPIDQMQFWPIGEFMRDYQDCLTVGVSRMASLPAFARANFKRNHCLVKHCPDEWFSEVQIPHRWHGKYWPKPPQSDRSGNLTRPHAPSDDVMELVHAGQITPKPKVKSFDAAGAIFVDGSRADVDAVVLNAGYLPHSLDIAFPGGWRYRHEDLYKGCFHPQIPNVAFVGMVRPMVGSIPAMAEMQARLVAQVFSGRVPLPNPQALKILIEQEAAHHGQDCPTLQNRVPYVYFFDRWMEEMAALIGARPKVWEHLGSWQQFQAFWFGAPLPLRFRLKGPGAMANSRERYAHRVNKLYGNLFGRVLQTVVLSHFFYPHLMAVGLVMLLKSVVMLPVAISLATLSWFLYMKVNWFRYAASYPLIFIGETFVNYGKKPASLIPNYEAPETFQTDSVTVSEPSKRKLEVV